MESCAFSNRVAYVYCYREKGDKYNLEKQTMQSDKAVTLG